MSFGNIGPFELIIVLGIVLVLFGAKRLPEMGASIGKGIRGFKEGLSESTRDAESKTVVPEPDRRNDANINQP